MLRASFENVGALKPTGSAVQKPEAITKQLKIYHLPESWSRVALSLTEEREALPGGFSEYATHRFRGKCG